MKQKLFDKEDEKRVLQRAADSIWEQMIKNGSPLRLNRCCVCGTTEGIHKDGWYGYRCNGDGCVTF